MRAWAITRYESEAHDDFEPELEPITAPYGVRFKEAINALADSIDTIRRERNALLDREFGGKSA